MTMIWRPGDHCVLRFVGHDNGVVLGYPQVVVEADEQQVVLYQPAGVRVVNVPRFEDVRSRAMRPTPRLPSEYVPPFSSVRVMPRSGEYAVEVYLAEDGQEASGQLPWLMSEGRFRGWKVNLQARMVEHELGFDTTDNVLDVVIRPDGEWRWKDEPQLEERVRVGLATSEESARWYAGARRVILMAERREGPFGVDWEQWRPDAGWGVPVLPKGWDLAPGFDIDLNRGRHD